MYLDKTYHTSEIVRMDRTLKGGTAIYTMMKLCELFCQNVSHRFLIFVPILASPDPNCERFSFRVFWICCAVTVNCTLLALNLRWVAWVLLLYLRFFLICLPSTWRCGLAETVGLCFRVDSDRVTLGFVLGLVCVCVCVCFVLFCCCCFVCCRKTTAL